MHCLTMLMMGVIADAMPMPERTRERHEKLRAEKFREVIQDGVFYGQPHSEPVEQGQTDTALTMGGRRFGTTARKVDGGYVVNGRKFFVSLAGAAPYYATPAWAMPPAMARRNPPRITRATEGEAPLKAGDCLVQRRGRSIQASTSAWSSGDRRVWKPAARATRTMSVFSPEM
jgi:hypothetical protein